MAFRGRGRGGRFGGGGGPCHAEKIKFELFPKIENLPDVQNVKQDLVSFSWSYRLQMSWKLSPYNYKGVGNEIEGHESIDVERYSAKDSKKIRHKPSLSDYIRMTDEYVPAELAVRHQRGRKRVRWNQESDMQKLDIFEELEKKSKKRMRKKSKRKKKNTAMMVITSRMKFLMMMKTTSTWLMIMMMNHITEDC
ncbi:uncharacterized protein LOC141684278 isoform X2 [Apium graveolens]|uniref:uncharacterized protein LOC141684278 isoform X2 n=1 Tax=Apium graveolens TaxID=4045 RepID=UPI003D79686A